MDQRIGSLSRVRPVPSVGTAPELFFGSALVDMVRRILQDELQARLVEAQKPPRSPWMTPPAAARASGVPLKAIRSWIRAGRLRSRIRNRSAEAKQQKYLVNVDDVVAYPEQAGGAVNDGDRASDRAHVRAQEILAARAAQGR